MNLRELMQGIRDGLYEIRYDTLPKAWITLQDGRRITTRFFSTTLRHDHQRSKAIGRIIRATMLKCPDCGRGAMLIHNKRIHANLKSRIEYDGDTVAIYANDPTRGNYGICPHCKAGLYNPKGPSKGDMDEIEPYYDPDEDVIAEELGSLYNEANLPTYFDTAINDMIQRLGDYLITKHRTNNDPKQRSWYDTLINEPMSYKTTRTKIQIAGPVTPYQVARILENQFRGNYIYILLKLMDHVKTAELIGKAYYNFVVAINWTFTTTVYPAQYLAKTVYNAYLSYLRKGEAKHTFYINERAEATVDDYYRMRDVTYPHHAEDNMVTDEELALLEGYIDNLDPYELYILYGLDVAKYGAPRIAKTENALGNTVTVTKIYKDRENMRKEMRELIDGDND